MMVELWVVIAALLVFVGCAIAGFAGALAAQVGLRRSVTSLEYAVADLETRVVREVKLRASAAGVKAKKQDEELLEQIAQKPPAANQPWWMQYVSPDLLKH